MTSDILIIGGGIISLAIAIELKKRGANVTAISHDFHAASAHKAAGMLAPSAEKIANQAMNELCRRSLHLYPDWTHKLEELSGLDTNYWGCGILAPVYQEDAGKRDTETRGNGDTETNNFSASQRLNVTASSSLSASQRLNVTASSSLSASQRLNVTASSYWLDRQTINYYQQGLGEEVIGGWWYPEDAQVDNRALAQALLTAAQNLGVELKEGIKVKSIGQKQQQVFGVQTNAGTISADHYILAAGAWTNELFPLPVRPKKGQMLSVRVPEFVPDMLLARILYGEEIYIVPRRDRRIIIGATNEDVGFTPHNTPAGIQTLLQQAIRLYPPIQNYPIEELWWGFRPATPDELPILGTSPCQNLTFATGHYRNGILLAPLTAALIADLIWEQKSDSLLTNFHYSRFHHQSSTSMLTHPTIRSQESGVRSQESGVRSQESGVRSQESGVRSQDSPLIIAGKTFQSRLMTGTGKYRNVEEMLSSVTASGCQIVTVAVRRVQTNAPGHEGLAEALDWTKIWMLPNTAGCQTAEDAVRVARLGREMAKLLGQEDNNFVKLEVIPDLKYLLPDPIGTLQAAEQLVKEGFAVLPYINADPMLALRLEEVGCATVMPLASPIGSGQGLKTTANIQIIIENAKIPVVVDAGIGSPSEAAQAMEMGADALLINSAIALSKNPSAMAHAMNLATVAGRLAYLAGRMPVKDYASPSSPLTGTITNN